MTQRTEQMASVIRVAVQRVITKGLNDPRVRGLISVTKVEVSPDLSDARVFVSILPAENSELTMHGLQSAAGHIQSEIKNDVAGRRLPRLSFRLDDSLKKQAMLDNAISLGRAAVQGEPLTPDVAGQMKAMEEVREDQDGPDNHPREETKT